MGVGLNMLGLTALFSVSIHILSPKEFSHLTAEVQQFFKIHYKNICNIRIFLFLFDSTLLCKLESNIELNKLTKP